jgi:hypothetical protein
MGLMVISICCHLIGSRTSGGNSPHSCSMLAQKYAMRARLVLIPAFVNKPCFAMKASITTCSARQNRTKGFHRQFDIENPRQKTISGGFRCGVVVVSAPEWSGGLQNEFLALY